MKRANYVLNSKRKILFLLIALSCMLAVPFFSKADSTARESGYVSDGIFRFYIYNGDSPKAKLVGCVFESPVTSIKIPDTVTYGGKIYMVEDIAVTSIFVPDSAEQLKMHEQVKEIIIPASVKGTVSSLQTFSGLTTLVFEGMQPPSYMKVFYKADGDSSEFRIVVPNGSVEAYKKVITASLSRNIGADFSIPLTPFITTSKTEPMEPDFIRTPDQYVYKVTQKAGSDIGELLLVSNNMKLSKTYLELPKTVNYGQYKYNVTGIDSYALYESGARIIIVPDSITYIQRGAFDRNLELLFLSRNCKVLPERMIFDEDRESSLKFVYIPQGVTTIEKSAFDFVNLNTCSIIVPNSVKKIKRDALLGANHVTFRRAKPLDNLAEAISSNVIVKVPASLKQAYVSALSSKKDIKFQTAKTLKLSEMIEITTKDFTTNIGLSKKLKTNLSKNSNETIYWASSNPDIFTISSAGTLKAVGEGTAYAVAYTRTSGLTDAIKVTVE